MDCNEIKEKVTLMLDGELSPEEKEELMAQITECKEYEDIYRSERCFKENLQKALVKKAVSPETINRIREYVSSNHQSV